MIWAVWSPAGISSKLEPSCSTGLKENALLMVHLCGFGWNRTASSRCDFREQRRQRPADVEILRAKNFRRRLEPRLGDKGRPAFEVEPARRAAIRAMALLVEASVVGHDVEVGGEKADGVHLVLDQPTCPLMQPELIARVGRRPRIGHRLDAGMRQEHDGEAA